jgi:cellulose 1,4-beta-cellobiosidase
MTVVTQFVQGTVNGVANQVKEIKRLYVQDGEVIYSPSMEITKEDGSKYTFDSISDDMCAETKTWMGEDNHWQTLGGMTQMNKAFEHGMVLVMSLWDDTSVNMKWLDGTFGTGNGSVRGRCNNDEERTPEWLRKNKPNSKVAFKNIRFGKELGSTYSGSDSSTTAPPVTSTTPTPQGVQQWNDQCGVDSNEYNWGNCTEGLVCKSSGDEFNKCIKINKLDLQPHERALLFKCFDKDGSGQIGYEEVRPCLLQPCVIARALTGGRPTDR